MAPTELRSETPSLAASPRISFSHDLSQYDVVPVEPHHSRLNSASIDFDFSIIREGFEHETSSADELFSGGKLLPAQIKTKPVIPPNKTHQSETNPEDSKTKDSKASEEKQSKTTSFWPFKRSSSLSGGGYGRGFCPLPLLSRSHSTGSAAASSSKTAAFSKPFPKENWQRNLFSAASASKSQGNTCCSGGNYWKPPLKKKGYGGYGNKGVRVNPVLNVPSSNLFGFGSIFSNGKDKNKKK